jgi:hypothetical protein
MGYSALMGTLEYIDSINITSDGAGEEDLKTE